MNSRFVRFRSSLWTHPLGSLHRFGRSPLGARTLELVRELEPFLFSSPPPTRFTPAGRGIPGKFVCELRTNHAERTVIFIFGYAGLYSPWSPSRGLVRLDASGSPRLPHSTRQSARTAPRHHRAALLTAPSWSTCAKTTPSTRRCERGGVEAERVPPSSMVRGGRRRTGVVAPAVR